MGRIVAVLLLVALAEGARGDAPLTTADLVRFLRAGISERTMLAELGDRGFAEPLDAAREAALRDAGASETLVVAVRRAAPAEKAPSPEPAPPRLAAEPPPARGHARDRPRAHLRGPTRSPCACPCPSSTRAASP